MEQYEVTEDERFPTLYVKRSESTREAFGYVIPHMLAQRLEAAQRELEEAEDQIRQYVAAQGWKPV